jgi:uncharacterized membrane protein YkvA (DUF1232 family)
MGKSLSERLAQIRQNVVVLFLAVRHPQTKWYCKIIPVLVVAYAFSPVDLIPDFIPVLGYLDDLIIIPIGIWISFKLIPSVIIEECRLKAEKQNITQKSILGLVIIVILWLGLTFLFGWIIFSIFKR